MHGVMVHHGVNRCQVELITRVRVILILILLTKWNQLSFHQFLNYWLQIENYKWVGKNRLHKYTYVPFALVTPRRPVSDGGFIIGQVTLRPSDRILNDPETTQSF